MVIIISFKLSINYYLYYCFMVFKHTTHILSLNRIILSQHDSKSSCYCMPMHVDSCKKIMRLVGK